MNEGIKTVQALAFHAALDAVDLDAVPVMTTDRHLDRKEQARLLRQLLKQLKVPHVSVTTPHHSMASGVDIAFPERQDLPPNCLATETEAGRRNKAAREKFERLLLRAFPNHDDRSDCRNDFYDFCWYLTVN